MSSVLVVDVGTSSVRSSVVDETGAVRVMRQVATLPSSPEPGQVEFDAAAIAAAARATALDALGEFGAVDAVGITNQRASTVVWDRTTGEPVGPGLRLAVAPEVDGDHPVPVGQLVELGRPHVVAQGDPVQQHQRPAAPPLHGVDDATVRRRQAVVDDVGRKVEEGGRHHPTSRAPAGRRAHRPSGVLGVGGPIRPERGGTDAEQGGAAHQGAARLHAAPPT